jgi:hypothetical protein
MGIISWTNQKTLSSSQIIFITLFLAGAQRCSAFLSPVIITNREIMLSQKPFHEPNWQILNFLHPISLCRITD